MAFFRNKIFKFLKIIISGLPLQPVKLDQWIEFMAIKNNGEVAGFVGLGKIIRLTPKPTRLFQRKQFIVEVAVTEETLKKYSPNHYFTNSKYGLATTCNQENVIYILSDEEAMYELLAR